ncbi:uncharacterized protein [Physcomitrium patens]|uniref:Transmembrane protein n=1 Tax=Physcomitrium patens TaxID=3218 RepID=A9S980_PHYPA|nr:uncharacterized protein LOC112277456 [Physcomitrium patens]PNR27783.1 hypothetical protein PHYPA_029935 [Physcomitrium patens]|eukprot:XP_024365586.1 uncharacterized protein LOC112277456 [Physcomitrella patens]
MAPDSSNGALPNQGNQVAVTSFIDSDDEECLARDQINILHWIENSERHKKALQFWETQDALCTRRVDSKRKQSAAAKNEVYQLIGFYSVFQGVLLTAVAQSNMLHCNHWYFPFILSALASISALVGICLKFRTVRKLEKTIDSEKQSRQIFVNRIQKLRWLGQDFKFSRDAQDGGKVNSRRNTILNISIVAVMLLMVGFSGTFLGAIHRILCNPGYSLLPTQDVSPVAKGGSV